MAFIREQKITFHWVSLQNLGEENSQEHLHNDRQHHSYHHPIAHHALLPKPLE
jgi:hypothetical protein